MMLFEEILFLLIAKYDCIKSQNGFSQEPIIFLFWAQHSVSVTSPPTLPSSQFDARFRLLKYVIETEFFAFDWSVIFGYETYIKTDHTGCIKWR